MAKSVGFTFSIGARLQSSVASVFDTVAGRAGRLKREMSQIKAVSGAAGKLTSAKATVDSLRAEAVAGKDVAKQLASAEKAYASAQRSAARYNVTVGNSASVHAKATAQMKRMEDALKRQETFQRNRSKRSEMQGEILGTLASAAVVTAPIKMAMDFESAMADAAKTIDGMRDEAGNLTPEFYAMERAVKQLGRELPLTHQELAALFAAGGQLGMGKADELKNFTTMAAHMAVAFNMGTEDAAAAIGGYRTALNLSFDDTREMLDLMNQFANTSSATEKDIAGIVNRVGALGDMAGIAYKPMTAMAATLAAMKIPEDKAATGIKNFMLALSRGEAASKNQKEAFASIGVDVKKLSIQMQADAEGAMIAVLQKINALPAHMRTGIMTEIFGKESVAPVAALAKNISLLDQNFALASDTTKYAGAMQKEFENRARTTANAVTIAKNKAAEFAITIGAGLLPALNDTLTVAGSAAIGMTAFAEAHPEAVRVVMMAAAAMVAFKVATLAGGFALTVVSDAWTMAKGVWAAGRVVCSLSTYSMIAQRTAAFGLAVGTRAVAAAQWLVNAAMSNNPIGWVIKGVMFLGGALATLYQTCEPVRKVLDTIWDGFLIALKPVTEKVTWVWGKIQSILSWFNDDADETEKTADQKIAEQQKAEAGAAQNAGAVAVTAPAPAVSAPPPALPGGLPPGMSVADAEAFLASAPAPAMPGGPAGAGAAGQGGLPDLATLAGKSGGMPAGLGSPVTLAPTFQFSFTMDGVPDREFGKRVLASMESEKTAIQRLLSGLLADAARVAYG